MYAITIDALCFELQMVSDPELFDKTKYMYFKPMLPSATELGRIKKQDEKAEFLFPSIIMCSEDAVMIGFH